MQKQVYFLLFCLIGLVSLGQSQKELVVLPITDYIFKENDSVTIVQVQLPESSKIKIAEKTFGLITRKYDHASNTMDTIVLGYGRCHLIKGNYYYFGIKTNPNVEIKKGDLLQMKTDVEISYKGALAKLSLQNIQFTDVIGKLFYNVEEAWSFSDNDEGDYLIKMVEDIKQTATEMMTLQPSNNMLIEEGKYKGAKLFDKMKTISTTDVISFLDYVNARPNKYKGHTWKVSETFATWLVSGAPEVIK